MHSFNFPFKLFKEDIKIMSFKFCVLYGCHMTLDIKRKQENNNKNKKVENLILHLAIAIQEAKKTVTQN